MDVNEQIAKEYFEIVENCMVRTDIKYGRYHPTIDLLTIDKNGNVRDIEVKWKSGIVIEDSEEKENGFQHIVNQLKDEERDKIIKELLGKKPNHKIFITTKHFFSKSKFDYWKKRFKEENIEVLFFDDIIPKLVDRINTKGKYESPILQTIRMLKYFKQLKE